MPGCGAGLPDLVHVRHEAQDRLAFAAQVHERLRASKRGFCPPQKIENELLGIPATPELAAGKAEIPEAPEPTGEGAARSEDGAAKPGKATATPDPESAADLILGVKDPHTKYVKVPGERRRTSTLPDTRIKQQSAYEGPAGGQAALAREGAGNSTRPFAHGWAPRAATARP